MSLDFRRRGMLVDKSSQAFLIATQVVDRARQLTLYTLQEQDCQDSAWLKDGAALSILFGAQNIASAFSPKRFLTHPFRFLIRA